MWVAWTIAGSSILCPHQRCIHNGIAGVRTPAFLPGVLGGLYSLLLRTPQILVKTWIRPWAEWHKIDDTIRWNTMHANKRPVSLVYRMWTTSSLCGKEFLWTSFWFWFMSWMEDLIKVSDISGRQWVWDLPENFKNLVHKNKLYLPLTNLIGLLIGLL